MRVMLWDNGDDEQNENERNEKEQESADRR
jgi:hypothetical protein